MTSTPNTAVATAIDYDSPAVKAKGATLGHIYEMAGIKPPAEVVERWVLIGWSQICEGLTDDQVLAAFITAIAGKLTDDNGKRITLDLYGRQFALVDFANIITAYKRQLERSRQEWAAREAEAKHKAAEEARFAIDENSYRANHEAMIRKWYDNPYNCEDWGGIIYKQLTRRGLLEDVDMLASLVHDKAVARLKKQQSDSKEDIRAIFDREARKRLDNQQPDINGEICRWWFADQKKRGVSVDEVLRLLPYEPNTNNDNE